MGAHTCGFAGKALIKDQEKNNVPKMSRISGLDPAGLGFVIDQDQNLLEIPESARLNPNDADLVDAIHTDGDGWGTYVPVGHTDFYPGSPDNIL